MEGIYRVVCITQNKERKRKRYEDEFLDRGDLLIVELVWSDRKSYKKFIGTQDTVR